MPEIKNTFLKGKMNKDLDDRLLPEGEYRDAQNIEVLKPDGENSGVLQNAAGNTLAHTALGLSTDIDVIGTYFDEKNKRIYWFVTDNNDLTATDWYINTALTAPRNHAIYYYDADPSSATYETAKVIVSGRFLKFSKKYRITGIALIDDLLFWTDNKNQPRRINVTKAIASPTFYDNELKISLAKYAPFTAPLLMTESGLAGTSTMSNDSAIENDFIKEEFVRFSYRYKYVDNEYSVLAPFTQIAFKHSYVSTTDYGVFDESSEIRAYESTELDGMINHVNKVIIGVDLPSINPNADFEIKEIEFIIKESDSTVARIVDTKTLTDASISSSFYTYTYKSDAPQAALPTDQITRVFDNVPTKAKALDIVGNRLVFGNYTQNIDIPTLDYTVSYGAKGTQTFTGDNSTTAFTLTLKSPAAPGSSLPPNNINQFNVYINDVLFASSNYTYNITTGVITFNSAPASGAAITVVLANHEYSDSSLKQRRTYQVGVVLSDIYGRQSPVILPTTLSNSIITVPARGTAAEFNSWVGDNLKITFTAQSGKLIPDSNAYSNDLANGIYATYNPYGWYSYKIVVKQLEQDYYNVYTPGATVVDNNSYITLFGDNINKVPRLMETISGDSSIARSDTILYPKVINTSFYTTTTTTEGKRSASTGGTTTTSDAMVYSCNQYMIFNRHASSAKNFKYLACDSTVTSSGTLTSSLTTVSLAARKKQHVWSMAFPTLTSTADIGFIEITQLTFNKVHDSDTYYGYGDAEVTDSSSGQIAKTIAFNTEKRSQLLSSGDELPITGIGKLSDFNSVKINTVQEYKRSSSVYDDAGGPFYQRESNHLVAQLPPYSISSSISNTYGVRSLFTDDTLADNTSLPDLAVTSYVRRGKAIDLAVFETKPVESAIDIYYETSTSGLINELNALETGNFTSSDVTVSNFAVAQNGTITAPTINVGSLVSVEYVNAITDASQTVGYDYPVVSTDTTRTARLTITAPDGYQNAGTNIIITTTATQADTSGATTVPLFSDLSLSSTTSTSSTAATFIVSATISSNGGASVSSRGFKIGTTSVYANATSTTVGSGTGTYTTTKSDATINTLYYVWAWATNSQGTNIQGPIQVTTPALGVFQVSDWTGSMSVNAAGTITIVAGNSPAVAIAPTSVSANSDINNTVSVTLGQATGTATTYSNNDNTIRIQIPTSGYSNSASTAYLYTAVRTVTQPAAVSSGTYTIVDHAIPSGFSIAADAVFTQGTISTGTLNSVALSGNALTDGASTNITTVTAATLRTLTLNITPGGSFSNSSAGNFTYNIVQPSKLPTLTHGSISTQSTVINSSNTVDLRDYFTDGKFFEITSDSTNSKISATIVNGYQLQLTGSGSCSDASGTESGGSIVVAAYNEKATVDGSVAGSTAAAGVVEKGDSFVSATVPLEVTACPAPSASIRMVFDSANSSVPGTFTVTNGSAVTYNISSIGSSFSNIMGVTIAKSGISTSMISNISNTGGFSTTLTDNGDTLTLGFSGNYPSQQANGQITYNVTFTAVASPTYASYISFTMVNAGYSASPTVIHAASTTTGASHSMNSTTITASAGNFTSAPPVFYANQTATGDNYIKVTSHNAPAAGATAATASAPYLLETSNPTSTTIAITGKAWVAVGDTFGYANVALVPTGVTHQVNSITINGIQKTSTSSTHTHYSINGVNTAVSFVVAATGAISYSLANVSVGSGISVSVSPSTSSGSATVTATMGSSASSGSFDFIATPTGGTAWTVSVTHTRESIGLNTLGNNGNYLHGLSLSAAQSSSTAACSQSSGNTMVYGPYSSAVIENVGSYLYTTDEKAYDTGSGQGDVFNGGNSWYRYNNAYYNGTAYVTIGNDPSSVIRIGSDGQIKEVVSCS